MKPEELKDDQIAALYVQLRDQVAEEEAACKNRVADAKQKMARLEIIMLQRFQESGAESVRTKHGTIYKSVKTRSSVADWDAFLDYVRSHDAWEMLTRACSKDAVKEYKNAYDDLPPGINWSEELSIGVRRS